MVRGGEARCPCMVKGEDRARAGEGSCVVGGGRYRALYRGRLGPVWWDPPRTE